jgi:carbon-monoxide dehydrogenase large subunit
MSSAQHRIALDVNGVPHSLDVPARRLLSDTLRHDLRLTGTHVGCEQGVCGSCTVLLDGVPVRSCLMLAVTADGHAITTVEGLADPDGRLSAVQQAFIECHGLQCGFCTPGFLTTITAYLDEHPDPDDVDVVEAIAGTLCRCTGYQNIKAAVCRASEIRHERAGTPPAGIGQATPSPDRSQTLGRHDPGPGMSAALVGERVLRREDARMVSGHGRYVDDVDSGAHGVAFVRSPYAHARVVDIDVTGALAVDGVVAIYTHADLPPLIGAPLPVLIPHPDLFASRTGHPLVHDVARYAGEPVVMVVAVDRYVAEDAASAINVTYEQLPPVVGLENAERAEHLVHPDVPGNVAAHMVQECGHAADAIAAAPHRLTLRVDIERSTAAPLEGRAVYARWDADDETMRVYSSTQLPVSLRSALASRLDLPLRQIEVVAPDTGGGFGMKLNHPWPEEVLVPWAARRLGHAVKFIDDRRETFIASSSERAQVHDIEVGFDDAGRILGLSVRFLHENGAYTPYGIIVPIITATQLPGPYKLLNYRVEFTCLYTNTVIVTPYRGAGRPQGVFAMERTIDRIAAFLDMDRTEVRAVNLIHPSDMPWDTGLIFQDGRPAMYDSGDYPKSLVMVKELIGWDDFPTMQAAAAQQGRRLGIGIGCYVEGTGVGPYEGAHIEIEPSGRVLVSTGLSTQGQGHETILAQIAADELGVPIEDIQVTTGDTRRFRYAVGTFASRTAVMCGNAVALAAKSVKAKALKIAAHALEASPDDLEVVDGIVRVKGNSGASISLGMVATLSNPLRYAFDKQAQAATQFRLPGSFDEPPVKDDDAPGLEGTEYFSPVRSTFASGMHAVVVETDPRTAEVKILKYAVVHDCGRNVNPMIVEGQVHGGVAQGVGGALYERMVYDSAGRLQTTNFMDFVMPYVTEVPATIDMAHLETLSTINPLGIKGAGEAGVIPTSAAIAAAIEDAEGIEISRMPISPNDLFMLRKTNEERLRRSVGKGAHA